MADLPFDQGERLHVGIFSQKELCCVPDEVRIHRLVHGRHSLAPTGTAAAQEPAKPPLTVVPDVDLGRYMGTWHEVARLPFITRPTVPATSRPPASAARRRQPPRGQPLPKEGRHGQRSEGLGQAREQGWAGQQAEGPLRPGVAVLHPGCLGRLLGPGARARLLVRRRRRTRTEEPSGPSRTPSMDEAALQAILDQVRANGITT